MTRTNCFGDFGGVKSCWGYKLKVVRSQPDNISKSNDNDTLLNYARIFTLKELQKATNNFGANTKLGTGGFSHVYKGTLENGLVVSIKVICNLKGNFDFVTYINILSVIRHRNVAQFIGYCLEGDLLYVVHEYVGSYTLHELLFNIDVKDKELLLSWPKRASICIGIARGIEYLHEGASHRVVHRDIKPRNVCLDDNSNPKIVDFEVAKFFDDDVSDLSGNLVGTMGYIDPNYMVTGRFTEKADVYGFGILLLEIISGKRGVDFILENELSDRVVSLIDWAWELHETGKVLDFVDPTLSDFPEDEVKRYIDVALSCVQSSPNLRPNMSEALLMLLGGYDFGKKVLRNTKHARTRSYHEDYYSSNDEKSDEVKLTVPQIDAFSPVHVSTRKQGLVAGSTFRGDLKQPATESMSKTARGFEIEIESDPSAHSTASELMEISHDLENEMYRSIEENASAAAPLTGPSDKNEPKHDLVSPSLNSGMHNSLSLSSDIHVHEEAVDVTKQAHISQTAKQVQMSQNMEDELQLNKQSPSVFDQISGEVDVRTTSAEIDSLIHVDRVLYQPEMSEIEEVVSPSEIDVKRSIQCTLEMILKALKHHKRILLHGRGGSGKTTVLKILYHHSAAKKLFDKVLFLTVPRYGYQKFVQDEFVRQLSLNLRSESFLEDNLSLIRDALRSKKFLVILDNVWEPINLHEIGIPDPSSENSCWVVLAARSSNVWHAIDSEIEMEVLSDAEAWALFCCQVGNVITSSEINTVARAISKECHGSPLIISAIGNALRAESSVKEWKAARKHLQLRQNNLADEQYSSRRHIQYCYDRLKARDLKIGFLYCALLPQDQEIDISMLVECLISEGYVGGTTAAAYKRGHDIVGHLINASLLETSVNGIKMHNVIRESALEIILSDYPLLAGLPKLDKNEYQSLATMPGICFNFITRAGAHLKDSPSVEEWEQASMIFLMGNELSTLPTKPSSFNLIALFLQRNSSLRVIPDSFFETMTNLKLLNLSETRIKSLPDSFSSLRSLQILIMRDCERMISLPPSIEFLKSLEVLDLQGTEITHLPDSVCELASLKQLRVSFYGTMNLREYKKLPAKLVSNEILSRLGLIELGMFVYPGDQRWKLSASGIVKEISCLKLSLLHFHFPKIEDLDIFVCDSQAWNNGEVTAFKFIVGPDFKRVVSSVSNDAELMYNESHRCLRFVNGESTPNAVVEILKRAISFYLDHHLKISYLSNFGIQYLNDLKICILRDCPELEGLVDSSKYEGECFPSLECLSINYLWNLKAIWGYHIGMGSFARLRYLSIYACPKLSYVFTSSVIGMLTTLEELIIRDCVSLKYVVGEDEDASNKGVDARKSEEVNANGPRALCSLKVLKLHYLPEICGIWTARWPPLEYMSFYNVPKLGNLHMKGNDGRHVKEIAVDIDWWDSLEWDDPMLSRKLQSHVTQIHIDDL